jgi:hypothetical protein
MTVVVGRLGLRREEVAMVRGSSSSLAPRAAELMQNIRIIIVSGSLVLSL